MVGGKYEDLGALDLGNGIARARCEPAGELLEPAERSGRLGQLLWAGTGSVLGACIRYGHVNGIRAGVHEAAGSYGTRSNCGSPSFGRSQLTASSIQTCSAGCIESGLSRVAIVMSIVSGRCSFE